MKNVILTTTEGDSVVVANVPQWVFDYAGYLRAGGQAMPVEQWLAMSGNAEALAQIEAERAGETR